jgi:hypothetical protein
VSRAEQSEVSAEEARDEADGAHTKGCAKRIRKLPRRTTNSAVSDLTMVPKAPQVPAGQN